MDYQKYKYEYAASFTSVLAVCLTYILTRDFPSGAVGFYFEASESILKNDWLIPKRIPKYTIGGIPFAYNPLPFYILASAKYAGIGYAKFTLFYSPLAFLLTATLTSYLSYQFTHSNISAVLAPLLLACYPSFLAGRITSGGVVRTTGLLFCILSILFCIKYYRSNKKRGYFILASLFLSLTLLSHPVYGLFSALSVFSVIFTLRSVRTSLIDVTKMGVIPLITVLPWLAYVLNMHGIEVFANAGSTKGGLFPGYSMAQNYNPFTGSLLLNTIHISSLGGLLLAPVKKKYLLFTWGLVVLIVLPSLNGMGHTLFLVVSTAFLAHQVMLKVYMYYGINKSKISKVLNILCLIPFLVLGLCYVSEFDNYLFGKLSQTYAFMEGPETVTKENRNVYKWVKENTPHNSMFIPVGSGLALESFPFWSERTMVLSAWGSEWLNRDIRKWNLQKLKDLRDCNTSNCLASNVKEIKHRLNIHPRYIYFSDNRGKIEPSDEAQIHKQLSESDCFDIVHQKGQTYVAKIGTQPQTKNK